MGKWVFRTQKKSATTEEKSSCKAAKVTEKHLNLWDQVIFFEAE
jgi:hypothetical protein